MIIVFYYFINDSNNYIFFNSHFLFLVTHYLSLSLYPPTLLLSFLSFYILPSLSFSPSFLFFSPLFLFLSFLFFYFSLPSSLSSSYYSFSSSLSFSFSLFPSPFSFFLVILSTLLLSMKHPSILRCCVCAGAIRSPIS